MQSRIMSRWLVLTFCGCGAHGIATAQAIRSATPPMAGRVEYISVTSSDTSEQQRRLAQQAGTQANLERQARLRADTTKLLKLAQELQNSVDKTNENILSMDVLKKTNEIEKLARSVKEKMKGSN